jgi:hypothetical protein
VVSFIGRKRIKYGSPLYKRDPSLSSRSPPASEPASASAQRKEVATVKITSELTAVAERK